MIIYNVTVAVERSIVIDWLNWMKTEHIPEIMRLSLFTKAQINKIISPKDSNDTFAISYTCLTMKDLHNYQAKFATDLQNKHLQRYGEKTVAFRTIMEVISQY